MLENSANRVKDAYLDVVSIIMPCRNEEKFIARCLDSIITNDYPKDKLELLIIDGRSTDRTREIVREYAKKYPCIKILDNPEKIQTFATNIGIDASKGDFVIRMDAHAEYPSDYISRLLHWIDKSGADVVGGICITKPGGDSITAEAIALALSHPFGVGNSYFRIGSKEPKHVDTVPFGCYRREVFEKVGFFNENLNRTDDIEFNLRLKKAGGKILMIPDIKSYYYARPNLMALARQNFWNGFWVLYSLKFVNMPFSIRHVVPFIFVLLLTSTFLLFFIYHPFIYLCAFGFCLYLFVNIFFSFKLSLIHGLKYLPALIVTFSTLHFSYGLGSAWGIGNLLVFWGKKKST